MHVRLAAARYRTRLPIAFAALLLVAAGAGLVPGAVATATETQTTNATPAHVATYFYEADPTAGSGATCASGSRVTSFDPAAGTTRTIFVCVEATDDNGWNDICDTGATSASEVHTFSVTDSADASISDDSHPKTNVALACATGSGTAVAMIGSFAMEFWRPAGSAGTAYKVTPTITDVAAASATSSAATFAYTTLTSLSAPAGTLDLGGALAPGGTGSDATAAIFNHGNAAFTIFVSGTSLTSSVRGDAIPVGSLKWATAASTAYSAKTALTGSSATTGLSAAADTSDTPTAHNVYLQLTVPAGSGQWVPATTYSGTVTFATS